jgi:hypothetical protein
MTSNEGIIVTARRTHAGMLRCRNPCIITWPAMVPTVEDDRPDAGNEIAKILLDIAPAMV